MIWKKCYQLLFCLLLSGLLPTAQAQTSETKTGVEITPAGRVLFVLSNVKFHGNSTLPASISFGEVVNAWDTFHAAGYAVDFVSPAGGAVPIDPSVLGERLTARLQDQRIMAGLTKTHTPDQIDASRYQAVYYVGGSNAMYQVVDDVRLQQISRQIYEQNNGVISAVCHGTAGIVRLKLSNGQYLLAGKRVTGYPEDFEDKTAPYFQHLPFSMRQTIEANGGLFKAPDPEKPYIEVDGRLVTGQNYPSAPLVASAVVQILKQQRTTANN
ncbi:type 1 glutamine amidotransferase domain-containing protein [Rheinheimera sp. SA_1]|uniref:type 1 glutamine amidotransferase domain-containing protein n=1 Tax=Rheinheimera sp. SA_1 TaxID=1827365 RepID=UPI000ABD4334|nr:type 1 glutamine amidotransferase domain-containing protein [Rheinheimera sp. SA_1]